MQTVEFFAAGALELRSVWINASVIVGTLSSKHRLHFLLFCYSSNYTEL